MTAELPDTAGAGLERLVEMAHRHLGLDVAVASEFAGGVQVVRALAGDGASYGLTLGDGPSLADTYCARMVAGDIPNLIDDCRNDLRVSHLPATGRANIGAYVGVPLRTTDGHMWGSLCCLSHDADTSLDERDVRFLTMVADMFADDLTEQRRRAERKERLSQLIETEDLQVACQPVVDLRTGEVLGMEALSRFPPPMQPDEAFPAAHQLGLGLELERLAVRKALRLIPELAPWQFLAFNVSPDVAVTLARNVGFPATLRLTRLVMEITEHSMVGSYPALLDGLSELRRRGLRIGVDDAGAGYASLRHIVELKPDFVKIDRSLVHGVSGDHARRIAISSFVLLALDLGATVIAEGIETRDDLSALEDLGVDAGQGYLLARPTSEPACLAEWTSLSPPGSVDAFIKQQQHRNAGGRSRRRHTIQPH